MILDRTEYMGIQCPFFLFSLDARGIHPVTEPFTPGSEVVYW